jgi:serine/threonine protein kinase
LLAGTKLGPYEVVSPIGAGGMGEVYRARDTRLNRTVAAKILPGEFSSNLDRMRRFQQEAATLSALNHPNLLTVYDVGVQGGVHYLVCEFLEGDTLRQRLDSGPLPRRKAIDYAVQISDGLAAAHERGIIHRDLKPENIFVTRDGRLKLLDFGLAKQLSPDDGARTQTSGGTEEGMVLGTVGYMSPEQVRGKPTDARSDIFATGVILYEMLTGKRAFHRDSAVETMNAILKEEPAEFPSGERNFPASIQRLILRCLEKSPDERFQSARDLSFAIEALSDVSSSDTERVIAEEKTRLLFKRGSWSWPVLISVVILAAAIVWPRSPAHPLNFTQITNDNVPKNDMGWLLRSLMHL